MDGTVTGNNAVYFAKNGVWIIEVFQDRGCPDFRTAVIGKGKLRDIALHLYAVNASAIDI